MNPDTCGPEKPLAPTPEGEAPPDRRATPVTFLDIVLMAVGIGVLLVTGAGLLTLLANRGGPEAAPPFDLTYAVLILEAAAIIASIALFAKWRRRISWSDLGLRPATLAQIRRAVVAGILCYIVVTPLLAGFNALLNEPIASPQAPFVVGQSGITVVRVALMLALGGLLVPFAEELFFRGVLYSWLRGRWGVGWSVFASAAVFGAAHAAFAMVAVGAFLVGVVLAVTYERSRTLWVPVTVHAVFNSVSLSVMFLGSAYIDTIR